MLAGTTGSGTSKRAAARVLEVGSALEVRLSPTTSSRRASRALRPAAPAVMTTEPLAVVPLSPEAERSFIVTRFHQMVVDKALPKYQFERRVDSMLAVLLPDLLSQLKGSDIRYVVSEFPLKKVSGNLSTKVDHVLRPHGGEMALLRDQDRRLVGEA